jgi:hypothetical protein
MPKKKLHPFADQFSDDEMDRVMRYGQALGGGVTPFDEEIERHLARYEANRKKKGAAEPSPSIAPRPRFTRHRSEE